MRKLFKDSKMKPNRRDFVKYSLGGILAASTASAMAAKGSAKKAASGKKKNVLFEDSCRVPMIAVIDGETKAGTTCGELVELIDIFQTFADLCGLKTPEGLEGLSFRPLFSDPYRKWKKGAYSQVRRRGELNGMSVRSKRFRYIEWQQKDKVIARELYDHASDAGEYRNLAKVKEFAGICKELSKLLKTGHNQLE